MLDDAAFTAWVERTHARSLRLARRILGGGPEAPDVVQDSYVRAFVALRSGRFRSDPARLDAWLRRIVCRASLDALRARRRRREDVDDGLDAAPGSAVATGPVDRRDLERAIADLPTEQRTAFVLREIEGFSLKETAAELGCSVGAVEQRVLRAWAGLKRRMHDGPR
jgi:RNA polymerase sigma-70 factor (ECF subfamily)